MKKHITNYVNCVLCVLQSCGYIEVEGFFLLLLLLYYYYYYYYIIISFTLEKHFPMCLYVYKGITMLVSTS